YLDLGNRMPIVRGIKNVDFKKKVPTFLFVGRVEKRKGIFELIKAFESLQKLDKEFKLIILGGGGDFDSIFEDIKKKQLDQCILLKGQISSRSAINDYYRESDVFILPSYTEGFPRVLYTAMEYGLPIITTMVGGIPSVMQDGFNCLAVRVGSSGDITESAIRLINSPDLFRRLKNNSEGTIRKIINSGKTDLHNDIVLNHLKNPSRSKMNLSKKD
ncbi:glycosyltransferase, partial [Akkermansiaceae bacterium]|nr:glycosyltransferase [Akkermansiaceae bacterium]